MRIISGIHKGRRLQAPKNLPVRPTTDFAKEGLFNILSHQLYFPEVTLLELFSGTGNISFEFASRGTNSITAVDAHFGCVKYISKIADELEMNITPIKSDVFKFLEKHKGTYSVVFADPPYSLTDDKFKSLIELVFSNGILEENGMLIVEHSKHTDLSTIPQFIEQRKYGGSVFSFFGLK